MDYKYDTKNNRNEKKKQINLASSEFWILCIKGHYQKLKYRAHLHSTYTKKRKVKYQPTELEKIFSNLEKMFNITGH